MTSVMNGTRSITARAMGAKRIGKTYPRIPGQSYTGEIFRLSGFAYKNQYVTSFLSLTARRFSGIISV
jgi:hypothetical protein